jgi:hypothetical protein
MLTAMKRITSVHVDEIQMQNNMYMHRAVDCLRSFICRPHSQKIQPQEYTFSLA